MQSVIIGQHGPTHQSRPSQSSYICIESNSLNPKSSGVETPAIHHSPLPTLQSSGGFNFGVKGGDIAPTDPKGPAKPCDPCGTCDPDGTDGTGGTGGTGADSAVDGSR